MESHRQLPLVYCLSVDMETPVRSNTAMPTSKQTRLNVLVAEQIKMHLEGLELTDISLKYAGNWLLMTNRGASVPLLCCLATILARTFKRELTQTVGIAADRTPSLRIALFGSPDRLIELPGGQKEWVGESAGKAAALTDYCKADEVLVDEAVAKHVAQIFNMAPANLAARTGSDLPAVVDDFAMNVLGDIIPAAISSSSNAEPFVYTLKAIGNLEAADVAATELAKRMVTASGTQGKAEEKPAADALARVNNLIAHVLEYPVGLHLLDTVKKAGLIPNTTTYGALIAKAPDYDHAKALFDMMLEDGIQADTLTYTGLVAKAPDYTTALTLHDAMIEQGIAPAAPVYSILVARAPDYNTAKAWLSAMQDAGFQPDLSSYSALISKALDYEKAKFWLDAMLIDGIQPGLIAFNRLLTKAPDYENAAALIQMMQEEGIRTNVITYNSLITKAVDFATANSWFDAMKSDGIQPNIDTFNRLFSKNLAGKNAEEVLAWYKEHGIDSEDPIQVVISTYQKSGHIDQALKIALDYPYLAVARKLIRETMDAVFSYLETIREEGIKPDIASYNALISNAPYYDTAKSWFDSMKKQGIMPNEETYNLMVAKSPDYNTAKLWLETMQREGVEPDVDAYNRLFSKNLANTTADEVISWYQAQKYHPDEPVQAAIATYRDIGKVDQALRLALEYPHFAIAKELIREQMNEVLSYLEKVKEEGIKPSVVTYSTLISKAPYYNIAESWLDTMKNKGVAPNVVTYNALISKAPDFATAKSLLLAMQAERIEPNVITYSTLVSKAPDYKIGKSLLDTMKSKGVAPNVVTYNALISKTPDFDTAASLLSTMKVEGIDPTVVTYNTLIHKSQSFEIGQAFLKEMQVRGVQPNIVSYNRLFSKNLANTTADEVISWYQAQKYHPDEPVQAAIATYRDIGKVDQALRLALEYPHLQVARKLIREHLTEALSYFKDTHSRLAHPNAEYALGIAFLECGRGLDAEPYLKHALDQVKPGPQRIAVEECLRRLDRELSKMV